MDERELNLLADVVEDVAEWLEILCKVTGGIGCPKTGSVGIELDRPLHDDEMMNIAYHVKNRLGCRRVAAGIHTVTGVGVFVVEYTEETYIEPQPRPVIALTAPPAEPTIYTSYPPLVPAPAMPNLYNGYDIDPGWIQELRLRLWLASAAILTACLTWLMIGAK